MKFQNLSMQGSKVTGGIKSVTYERNNKRMHKPKAICPQLSMILRFRTDRSGLIVLTKIRREKQSDQVLHFSILPESFGHINLWLKPHC